MKLSQFINGLGIRNVGVHASKILDETFNGKIENIMDAEYESLLQIHEVGAIMAQSIVDYFGNEKNKKIITRCMNAGITFKTQKTIKNSKISGKIFAITGSLTLMKRAIVKEKIEEHNARLASNISKNTNYLILGGNPGSKLEKAKKLNITIINEQEFLTLLRNI